MGEMRVRNNLKEWIVNLKAKNKKPIVVFVLAGGVFFVINKAFPFFYFLEALKLSVDIFVWLLLIAGALYYLNELLKADEKNIAPLVKDEEQAEKFYNILKNKCKGRKALMITVPWGFSKTDFYEVSLRPLLKKNFLIVGP